MTGSGMGCPDWPKCFGSWIPPTHISQLPEDYKETYANRGYDELDFNVFNTWTEYINRLLGLISGLLCVGLLLISILTKHKVLIFYSCVLVLMMGFQAWMGALVVYSILAPLKITIHMLIALLILSLIMFLHRITSNIIVSSKGFGVKWVLLALTISVIQIVMGTQVREEVDTLLYTFERSEIIMQLPIIFEVHRTFAWLVVIVNFVLLYNYQTLFKLYFELKAIVVILCGLFVTGLLMSYHSMQGLYQCIHLIFSVLLFLCQFSILLKKSHFPSVDSP